MPPPCEERTNPQTAGARGCHAPLALGYAIPPCIATRAWSATTDAGNLNSFRADVVGLECESGVESQRVIAHIIAFL
jgi:hypothetical protein